MSLITRNAKEYRSVTAQLMSQNLPIAHLNEDLFSLLAKNSRNVLFSILEKKLSQ